MEKTRILSLCFVLILCFSIAVASTRGQVIHSASKSIDSSGVIIYNSESSTNPTPSPTPTLAPTSSPTQTPTPTISPTPHPTTSPTPKPSPTRTPTPSPTPTLTPTSTPTPNSKNLAPINDGKWYSDSSWSICPVDNIYTETNSANMHNNAATWRIQTGPSLAADHDWGSLVVKPGDHVVITVWVKTLGTPDPVLGRSGATIGIDFYTSNYGGSWARIGGTNCPGLIPLKGDWGDYGWADSATFMVPWGSNWVQRTYDFIVPSQWWGDGVMSINQVPRGTYATPGYLCPWVQISANYGSTSGTYTSWFSDFQLYINP